jgi:hypothetical protein
MRAITKVDARIQQKRVESASTYVVGGLVLKMRTKVLSAVLVGFCTLWLAGCPQRTTIERINRDPGRFVGKEVTIAGRVSSSFGALGSGVFEVDDGTGRMWVFSQSYGVPGKEARVAVTGRIEQGFNFGGRSFATILRETQRRH